ncbi:MAG: COX15/CtaA family protein [Solirubrobacterales bacterium]
MASAPSRGGRDALARFRRLVSLTIVATLALVVIGGVVRVSDSGLGCGPPGSGTSGWPLCDGQVLPFLEGSTLIEFSHRIAAAIVGVLILLVAWQALRHLRDRRWIVRGSIVAGVLVLSQAVLGGATVENNLDEVLVAAHLGLAMLLLGTLVALRRIAVEPEKAPVPAGASRGLRGLAIVASVLVLATIVAGGYVAGTEEHGVQGSTLVNGAHTACGEEFPTCLDGVMPYGVSRLTDIHLTHRAFMYLASAAVIALFAFAWVRGVRTWPFKAALGILIAQVLLGALNVWLGKHAGLIVAHLTIGTLLWATLVQATMGLVPAPAPLSSPARSRREEAPAPA